MVSRLLVRLVFKQLARLKTNSETLRLSRTLRTPEESFVFGRFSAVKFAQKSSLVETHLLFVASV